MFVRITTKIAELVSKPLQKPCLAIVSDGRLDQHHCYNNKG